ncbi:hypothetical protein A5724_23680 [Mycobacterium sp. ACS1612]|nr:hypothetical protein A5724_23680 [Mycobacterium sp. ACS1612]
MQQGQPAFDPEQVINAHETNLADYLNQPVQDILARLGLPRIPSHVMPPDGTDGGAPAPANPLDPTQMIKPATDALGTLGTGQFNNGSDPTQIFQGISQAFESAAEPLAQGMAQLASVWQGVAGPAAGAATSAAVADGSKVASQASSLGQSLSSVVATVSQTEARLIAIINEFIAKIIAIGPNIIFPWGIAQAIQAATEAVTEATDAMTEAQGAIGAQAAQVSAVGAPVPLAASTSRLAATTATTAAVPAVSTAAAPGIGSALQFLSPLTEVGTSLISPVMEGVTAATQAAQSGAGGPDDRNPNDPTNDPAAVNKPASPKAGGSAGAAKGMPTGAANSQLAPQIPAVPKVGADGTPLQSGATLGAAAGAGGSAMTGGPMGGAGKAGAADGRHNPAAFLHTSNDQLVGDLGNAAPPVLGQIDPAERSDMDLRI